MRPVRRTLSGRLHRHDRCCRYDQLVADRSPSGAALMESITLHDFPGGLKLDPRKATHSDQPISVLPTPSRVWVPTLQHRGKPALVCVEVGQVVEVGSLIGRADGAFSANVHASVAGVVTNIAPRVVAHRSGLNAQCVEITSSSEQPVSKEFLLHGSLPALVRLEH